MGARLLLFFLIAFAASAQDDPKDLLLRVSQNVTAAINRMPNYVCTQTIERSEYRLNGIHRSSSCDDAVAEQHKGHLKRHLFTSDRLRFDVAEGVSHEVFGLSNEMYSWVGDNSFHDRGLLDLVRQGAISTGTFSSLLFSIFSGGRASFSYNGDRTVDGRLLAEFGFRVPADKSNYVFIYGNGRTEVVTGYDGTFLVDPRTLEIVRLVVRQSLPQETNACEADNTIDFGNVSIGGTDILLAREARLNILTPNEEWENQIAYSACHEFVGQSVLSFDPPTGVRPPPAKGDVAIGAPALSPGLPFTLAFTEPINTAVASAGDPIQGKLLTAILDPSSKIVVPAGSVVSGRIVEVRRFYSPRSLIIGVRLDTVNVGGIAEPLRARSDSGFRRFAIRNKGVLSRRVELGPIDLSQLRDVGTFEFRGAGQNYVIKSGYRSKWLTLAPEAATSLPAAR